MQTRRPQGAAWPPNGPFWVLTRAFLGEVSSAKRLKIKAKPIQPKVVQKVPSSVAVLCSRGAIEQATGQSLAPQWSVLGAFGGLLGRGFLGNQAQNERSIGGGPWGGAVGGARDIQREMPASHCKAKALDTSYMIYGSRL